MANGGPNLDTRLCPGCCRVTANCVGCGLTRVQDRHLRNYAAGAFVCGATSPAGLSSHDATAASSPTHAEYAASSPLRTPPPTGVEVAAQLGVRGDATLRPGWRAWPCERPSAATASCRRCCWKGLCLKEVGVRTVLNRRFAGNLQAQHLHEVSNASRVGHAHNAHYNLSYQPSKWSAECQDVFPN